MRGSARLFSGSPIKRIGRDRLVRNCLIAAGNSGNAALEAPVRALLTDPDPVVAEAAGWALARAYSSSLSGVSASSSTSGAIIARASTSLRPWA